MEGEIKNSLIGMKKIIEILLLVSLISFFTSSSFSQDKNDNSSKEKNENIIIVSRFNPENWIHNIIAYLYI